MSVNGVTSTANPYSAYTAASSTASKADSAAKTEESTQSKADDTGVVYEPSSKTASSKKTYKPDTNLVAKLKADAEARTSQLKSLVEQLMTQQGQTYGKANDIWSILSSGNLKVDPATRLQAQADIAEDGYWGVKQTSQRILDFATALTGGDPAMIEKMRSAFEKGYKLAEKKWGGELPDICKQTYDAVFAGFDKMAKEAGLTTEN